MSVLSFDISSGGVSAALFTPDLKPSRVVERKWAFSTDDAGSATLELEQVLRSVKETAGEFHDTKAIDAISIACFMHSLVLLDENERPLTPAFTWLDQRGEDGVLWIRQRLGDRFHQRTGCRFHPMFPVFKLASLRIQDDTVLLKTRRAVSVKSAIVQRLTGVWAEDYGMASSSGLYNIVEDRWDPELSTLAGLRPDSLVPVYGRNQVAGHITSAAAAEFQLPAGTPVVHGSGDGLLANTGSACESPECIAVTLGTSASARQSLPAPVLEESAGTFCYKADQGVYVLGCAGNNGGNVLDWGRSVFGAGGESGTLSSDVPMFMPFLYGERSPDWNTQLTGTWYGLTARHRSGQLKQSIIEGVIFNLVQFVEILIKTSQFRAQRFVLSGNGFRSIAARRVFAALVASDTLLMPDPGLESLRGAAVCALRALGQSPSKVIEDLLTGAQRVPRERNDILEARFDRYKKLRTTGNS
jgi:gluconokinase